MKVRQLRKRKPVPRLAANLGYLRRTIRRAMTRLLYGKPLRNDAAGRAAVAQVVAPLLPPPVLRFVVTVPRRT